MSPETATGLYIPHRKFNELAKCDEIRDFNKRSTQLLDGILADVPFRDLEGGYQIKDKQYFLDTEGNLLPDSEGSAVRYIGQISISSADGIRHSIERFQNIDTEGDVRSIGRGYQWRWGRATLINSNRVEEVFIGNPNRIGSYNETRQDLPLNNAYEVAQMLAEFYELRRHEA